MHSNSTQTQASFEWQNQEFQLAYANEPKGPFHWSKQNIQQQNIQQENIQQENQQQQQENEQQQQENQQQQPEIPLPQEALDYESALQVREQIIRGESETAKETAATELAQKKAPLLENRRVLKERLDKFKDQAKREKDEEVNRLTSRANYATKYMDEHLKKVDALKNKYEEDLKNAEERFGDNSQELKKEKDRLFSELLKQNHEMTEEAKNHLENWNEEQDKKLTRRTARFDKRCRAASDALKAVDSQIKAADLEYQLKCKSADDQLKLKMEDLESTRYRFNAWKNYYRAEKTRELGNVLQGFQVVENDQQVHEIENMPINFWEWKAKLERDVKKFDDDTKAAAAQKELHEKLVEQYRDVKADFDELVSGDLETITDFKVNGEDTLDLLRLRQKQIDNGTFGDKVVYAEEYAEKKDLEAQRKAEKDIIPAGTYKYKSRERLEEYEERARKKGLEIEENKKKQEELERQKAQLENELYGGKEVLKQLSEEETAAIETAFETMRIKVIAQQADAEERYAKECIEIDQKVSANKMKKELAESRKADLYKECSKQIEMGNNILSLLIDEAEETVSEKVAITEKYVESLKKVEEQQKNKTLSEAKGQKAMDKAMAECEAELFALNEKVKKNRSAKDEKKKKELEDKLGEIEAKRFALIDEEKELNEDKIRFDEAVLNMRAVKQGWEEKYQSLYDEIQTIKKRRQEREERLKEEKKPSGWSIDEEAFLNLVSEIIYARDTWEMDNETVPGARLFNVAKKYAKDIGRWMGNQKKAKAMIKDFAQKLPLTAFGVESDFITRDIFTWLEQAHKYAVREINKKRKEAGKRNEARQKRKDAKIQQIEKERQKRAEALAKDQQYIADLKEEEEDRKEAEYDRTLQETYDEAVRQELIEEHQDAMNELTAQLDKEAAEKLEEMNRSMQNAQKKVTGFFSWMFGQKDEAKEKEEEEKRKQEEQRKKEEKQKKEEQERLEAEKNIDPVVLKKRKEREEENMLREARRLAREERKKARDARKAERERLDAAMEEEWEKEIEKAGEDEDSFADRMILEMPDEYLLTNGMEMAFEGMGNPEENPELQKLAKLQNDLEVKAHKFLRSTKKVVEDYINKNMGEAAKPEPIEQVPYYKQQGISDEERTRRINLGKEQLTKMVNNSLKGEDGEGQFVRNVLSTYLAKANILDVRSMLASAIRNAKPADLPEDATQEQKNKALSSMVGGLFKGAGPLMQKILQGLPDSMIPQGMQDAFDDMKSNLAPIPRPIVEAQLLSMVERSNGRIERIEISKSLGAASVGQAFLCKVYRKGSGVSHEVVIKLLRPDVRNRMFREKKIMQECASKVGKGMAKTYDGLLTRYMEELDLTIEARNCELGRIYDNKDDVTSMSVSNLTNPTPNALMVDLAPGDTVINVLKNSRKDRDTILGQFYKKDEEGKIIMENDNPKIFLSNGIDVHDVLADITRKLSTLQQQQRMLCNLSAKWVNEAVFGEGFYHGDLHSGNIMMSDNKLTVIDFGNATKLDLFQQEKITVMLMAAAAGSGSGFMEGFTALLGEDSQKLLETKKDELAAVFSEVMKLGDYHSSAERIAAALVRAQKLGFELPPAIYGFQQCQIRLMNTLDSFNKEIEELQKVIRSLKEAQNATIMNTKAKYDMIASSDVTSASNMKMCLLSDKEEDLRPLLHSRDEDVRRRLKNIFKEDFDPVMDFRNYSLDVVVTSVMGQENSFRQQYAHMGKKVFDISIWNQILTEHGFNMQREGREPADIAKQYSDRLSQLSKEEKETIASQLQASIADYDVLGALNDLWKAQDEGKSEDELRALEDVAMARMRTAKAKFLQRAEENLNERIEDQFEGMVAENPEVIEQAKAQEKSKHEQYMKLEGIFDPIKEKLRIRKNIPKVEDEIKPLFDHPIYGQRLKDTFNAFKNAPDDAVNREELLGNFMEAYRMPALLFIGNNEKNKTMFRVYMDKPDSFLNVMGEVIDARYKEALKRVSLFKSVKYGFRIKGDIEKKNLTTWEFVKMMYRRMKGEDI